MSRILEVLQVTTDTLEEVGEERDRLRAENQRLRDALGALGVVGGGYCFCSDHRDPDRATHQPECRIARAALGEKGEPKP